MRINTTSKTITFTPDEGFGALLEAAELLGWEDKGKSANDGDFTPREADGLDEEAREFIESKGFSIAELEYNAPDSLGDIFETIWSALHAFREDCFPEGEESYDDQWGDICTAMAWLQTNYGSPEKPDDRAPEVVIAIKGGSAELVRCADGVLVSIRDYDLEGGSNQKTQIDGNRKEYAEIGNMMFEGVGIAAQAG